MEFLDVEYAGCAPMIKQGVAQFLPCRGTEPKLSEEGRFTPASRMAA
jgi:hypothetical protein